MSVISSLKTYYINIAQDKKYPIIFGENAYLSIDQKDLGDATAVSERYGLNGVNLQSPVPDCEKIHPH